MNRFKSIYGPASSPTTNQKPQTNPDRPGWSYYHQDVNHKPLPLTNAFPTEMCEKKRARNVGKIIVPFRWTFQGGINTVGRSRKRRSRHPDRIEFGMPTWETSSSFSNSAFFVRFYPSKKYIISAPKHIFRMNEQKWPAQFNTQWLARPVGQLQFPTLANGWDQLN